jgi:hypothetical protein
MIGAIRIDAMANLLSMLSIKDASLSLSLSMLN